MSGIYVDWRLSENGVGMGALYFSPLFGAYCLRELFSFLLYAYLLLFRIEKSLVAQPLFLVAQG